MAMKVIRWEEGQLIVEFTIIMVLAHVNAVDLVLLNLDVEVLLQLPMEACIGQFHQYHHKNLSSMYL